jgi:hypothetical protein
MSQILNEKVSLSDKFIKKLSIMDKAINEEWLLTGKGEMLKNIFKGDNNIVASGHNTINAHNDNRQYYSDSPDVLRAQVEEKDILLREKDERLREKDAYIKELKETIHELKTNSKK